MKNLFILFCVVIFGKTVISQTNTFPSTGSAGLGTITPNTSSILELISTSKGLLAPRMTKTQRDAIVSPATGLLIFQTNSTPGFYYYSGSSWTAISTKGANTSLSNLSAGGATVNQSLNPQTNNILDLGAPGLRWNDIYITNAYFNDGSNYNSAPILYSAGTGINISSNSFINTGDLNAGDDLIITMNSSGDFDGIFSDLQLKTNSINANEIITASVGSDEIANASIIAADIATMGATTNQLLRYSGTAWAPATVTSTLTLPYLNSVASAGNLLSFTNTGTGAAFHGKTTTTIIPAIYAENLSFDATGIYGISNVGTTAKGVNGYAPAGYGIEGSSQDGYGVFASATGSGYGLYGHSNTSSGGYFSSAGGPALVTGAGNVGINTFVTPVSKLTVNNNNLLKSLEISNSNTISENICGAEIIYNGSFQNKVTGIYCSVDNWNAGAVGNMIGINIYANNLSTNPDAYFSYGLTVSRGNSLGLNNNNYIGLYSEIHPDFLLAEPGPDDWSGQFIGKVLFFNSDQYTHSIGKRFYSSIIDSSNFSLNVFKSDGKCLQVKGSDTTSILIKSTEGYYNNFLSMWIYTFKAYDIALNNGKLNFNSESTELPIEINNSDSIFLQIKNEGITISKDSIPVPEGYTLAVDGKIIAENINIRLSSTWPDYVFENNYDLMNRNDLEQYVNENKHLPNIPTAEAINVNGFEIGEMQKLLIQKIEDLTLYIIEDQKKLDAINLEMETIKNQIQQ